MEYKLLIKEIKAMEQDFWLKYMVSPNALLLGHKEIHEIALHGETNDIVFVDGIPTMFMDMKIVYVKEMNHIAVGLMQ